MLKRQELEDPNSCLNKAADDELIFVLLSRDPAASAAIRYWIDCRLMMKLNGPGDQKIVNAEELAQRFDKQRRECKREPAT